MPRMSCLAAPSGRGTLRSSDWPQTIMLLWDCIPSLRPLLFRRFEVVVIVLCTGQYVLPLPPSNFHPLPLVESPFPSSSDFHPLVPSNFADWPPQLGTTAVMLGASFTRELQGVSKIGAAGAFVMFICFLVVRQHAPRVFSIILCSRNQS